MEKVNIPGFGPGKVEIDVYTFDALPDARFKRVGDAFQPILDQTFYVGQPVWCELYQQQGVVTNIDSGNWPIEVTFSEFTESYSFEGHVYKRYRPTLRPLQKFNVGQRVKDGRGNEGVVISNTFKSSYPVMVQWDGDFTGQSQNSYDPFTSDGNYLAENSNDIKDINHA